MTSVQNHRPRLNGNSLGLLILLCLFIQCNPTQRTTKGPARTQDPVTKPKIDTIVWTEPSVDDIIVVDPVIIDPEDIDLNKTSLKDGKLGIILPLKASDMRMSTSGASSRDDVMIHYYTGLVLGLKALDRQGLQLEVLIKDSEEDVLQLDAILKSFKREGVKYIFGGKGSDFVEKIASHASEHEMFYVSGWQANSKFVETNENYIQLNPGFQAHALTILRHALKEFRADQIVLFGSKSEESRLGEINRLYMELTGSPDKLETFIVEDLHELEELEMEDWKENEEQMVFIAPITRNFNLVHDFFRFLAFNELHEKSIVYGMTEWNSEKLYNYMNNFDVRLTSMWNPDVATNYSAFEESFFSRLGILPNSRAYEGYGHIMIMGDFISKMRSGDQLMGLELDGLGMHAKLVDRSQLENPGLDKKVVKTYMENGYVHLLGFRNFRYHIIPQ